MTNEPKDQGGSPTRWRLVLGYVAMLVATAGLFTLVLGAGKGLVAGPAPAGLVVGRAPVESSTLAQVLLALAVVVVVARVVARLFGRWLGQPPVMGEIAAGIVLGPSVLGAIAPGLQATLLPAAVAPQLGIVAKIGVVIFMFLVGLELDTKVLRGSSHATVAISHASIVAPFLLGSTLALGIYPIYSNSAVSFGVFALFLGVSMSVTAFPVLARILTDRKLSRTPLGTTAIACAAIDDVTAWCLLALVSGVARARIGSAFVTLAEVVGFVAFMGLVARPLVRKLAEREEGREGPVSHETLAIVLGGMLISAFVTESIGIHALFGAFLFGALIPHDGRLASEIRARLEDVVVVLLLPIFFAFTGMRTRIGLVETAGDWAICGLVVLVATVGKLGGSAIAARLSGLPWRESGALGVLMNTRGLMELIVLNVGLDMGVISPTLFAMLVLMALVTTFATTPIVTVLLRSGADRMQGLVAPAQPR